MVITVDSDSTDPGSIPGGRFLASVLRWLFLVLVICLKIVVGMNDLLWCNG